MQLSVELSEEENLKQFEISRLGNKLIMLLAKIRLAGNLSYEEISAELDNNLLSYTKILDELGLKWLMS